MSVTFACPQCGAEVKAGKLPGRQVRCARCETLLELPFLPRMGPRQHSRLAPRWVVATLGVLVFAALVVTIGLQWSAREAMHRRERAVAQRLSAADSAQAAGHLSQAVTELTAAIDLARRFDLPVSPDRILQRADLVRREVTAQLDVVNTLEPGAALGEYLTLRARAESDSALDEFREPIASALALARNRKADADLKLAERTLEAGRYAPALEAAARAWDLAEFVPPETRDRIRASAESLAAHIASTRGVVAESITEKAAFSFGTSEQYEQRLVKPALTALGDRGFVTKPSFHAWQAIWSEHATYRFLVEVEEKTVPYLTSVNRGSQIATQIALSQGGRTIWSRQLTGQTRVPPHGMAAYEASFIAAASKPSPLAEHRLHDDALNALTEKLTKVLSSLPSAPP